MEYLIVGRSLIFILPIKDIEQLLFRLICSCDILRFLESLLIHLQHVLILNIGGLRIAEHSRSLYDVIVITLIVIILRMTRALFVYAWFQESKLPSDQLPVGEIVDYYADFVSVAFIQQLLSEVIREVHLELLDVLHKLVNSFFFGPKVGIPHLVIWVLQILANM